MAVRVSPQLMVQSLEPYWSEPVHVPEGPSVTLPETCGETLLIVRENWMPDAEAAATIAAAERRAAVTFMLFR